MHNTNKNTWQAGSSLTAYHWQRSRDAQKAVEEMSKHPYSSQESTDQINRNELMLELEAQGVPIEEIDRIVTEKYPHLPYLFHKKTPNKVKQKK